MHDISKDVTLSYRSAIRAIIFLSRCAYIYQYEEKLKFASGTIFNDVPCGNCFYIGITFDLDQKKLQKIMKFENYKNAHCSKTSQIIRIESTLSS